MAKMHTGGHGKAKSRKPDVEMGKIPEELQLTRDEIKEFIVGYAKQKVPQALIGQRLKEEHNVKYIRQVFGKRLGSILEEEGLASPIPSDLFDLLRKAVRMREHIAKNHNDVYGKTRLARIESKIWRLTKYYKREGLLPSDWKYEPEKAALLIKGV
jgi:small subunit ribosomal protein S15